MCGAWLKHNTCKYKKFPCHNFNIKSGPKLSFIELRHLLQFVNALLYLHGEFCPLNTYELRIVISRDQSCVLSMTKVLAMHITAL